MGKSHVYRPIRADISFIHSRLDYCNSLFHDVLNFLFIAYNGKYKTLRYAYLSLFTYYSSSQVFMSVN